MHKIDLDTWDRKEHFAAYRGWDFPYINVGANVDVTALLEFAHRHRLSSYLVLVHTAHRTAHDIINFKYRIVDDAPVLFDTMGTTFTYMPADSELFINVLVEYVDDIFIFHETAQELAVKQGNHLGLEAHVKRVDLIRYSAIPWIQYTHFVRTITRSGVDSSPKISWGKYFNQDDRVLVPFSVQVHHGLMDGLHLGRYFERLQYHIDALQGC
ncbi:MAG: CatA-like O-acetyltransferase [Thermoleophilia bacterium]|jgi:chloramphenicol O-acetyltransferase type A